MADCNAMFIKIEKYILHIKYFLFIKNVEKMPSVFKYVHKFRIHVCKNLINMPDQVLHFHHQSVFLPFVSDIAAAFTNSHQIKADLAPDKMLRIAFIVE